MRNLISFLLKHSTWFVYLGLAILSAILLVSYNPYHQSVYYSSSSRLVGDLYATTSNLSAYYDLRAVNSELLRSNSQLHMQLEQLQQQLQHLPDSLKTSAQTHPHYQYSEARVVNNSTRQLNNYITIDKGCKDGLYPEMGLVDQNGVVGIISVVSDHYAVALSLLNTHLRLSCKVKGSNYFGSLVWNAKLPTQSQLVELPEHAQFNVGDTIITSGYSAIFPEGVPVGTVLQSREDIATQTITLDVKLFTNFSHLTHVQVVANSEQEEQRQLEEKALRNGI